MPRPPRRLPIDVPRQLRRQQTPAEAALWKLLRDRRFLGLKFRRQEVLGSYVVDFCCHRLRLIAEVDGGIHDRAEQKQRDADRDAYLVSLGFSMLRIRNEQILDEPEAVLLRLESWVDRSISAPQP